MSDGSSTTCPAIESNPLILSGYLDRFFYAVICVLAFPTVFWLLAYLIPQVYMAFFRQTIPDLKKRYNAKWSLVTGAGSGIGKSIAFKLASQGLNVVLVSLDDDYLKQTVTELRELHPTLEFRSIGVTFAPGMKYMESIHKTVSDIHDEIIIVFCNAGYLLTGFFDQTPIEKILANIECNALSAVTVSHTFIERMVKNKRKGCVVFTSSVAGYIPSPFAVMYASTKAFISQFAASVHIECQPIGIDVLAVHPSPVQSNFYSKLDHKVDMIEAAAKSAVTPDIVCDEIFRSIGCCALRDIGALAWVTRICTFFIPYNLFTELFALAAPYMPDWINQSKNR